MGGLVQDLRYAARSIAKAPGFAAVAVLTLAVGVGAATSMFTLLDQVVLRPLPVKEPRRLAQLRWEGSWCCSNTGSAAWTYPLYEDLKAQTGDVFEEVFARYNWPASFGHGGETVRISLEMVTGNYFQALGVGAALGRTIGPDDDVHADGHPVAVLGYDFWQERFGGRRDVLGEKIQVDNREFEIIGVAARGFRGMTFQSAADVFAPSKMKPALSSGWQSSYNLTTRVSRWINVFGRLRPGMTLEKAEAALAPVFARLVEAELQDPGRQDMSEFGREQFRKATLVVMPGFQGPRNVRDKLETPLWLMLGMSGLLLAIACANVANLLIARGAARQREIAVRLALGVGRGRLLRQLLLESLMIAGGAAAAGLLLAQWTTRFLLLMLPNGADGVQIQAEPDLRVLAFTIGVAAVTAVLFGLAPGLQALRVQPAETLKSQGGSIAGGNFSVRKVLVGAQVFLSLVLLAGAGLFAHTLLNLQNLDPGFDVEPNLVFGIEPAQNGYTAERQQALVRELRSRLGALPAVEEVGVALVRVLSGNEWDNNVKVAGYEAKDGESLNIHFNAVSPGYFGALGIPVVEGRDFNNADRGEKMSVAIVNEKFAKYFFQDRSAIGRIFRLGGDDDPPIEIVGVIPDVRYEGVRDDIPRQMFVPYDQASFANLAEVFVRTSGGDPVRVAAGVRQIMRELDPLVPIFDMRPMTVQLAQSLSTERLIAFLAAAFGLTAAGLCAVGLYGVLSYSVTRRTKEIGLRLALGAEPWQVRRLVAGEALRLFAVAAVFALPTAFGAARLVESQLYGIQPYDPTTLLAATVLLGAVAWLAGYGPARRAARTEPMQALRFE
ncbi:MAG: FtsX-like permease family protein [Acidobacteria bacterium]|nr:FtsX-like permease family protein [Acidobacteriota bacterium]